MAEPLSVSLVVPVFNEESTLDELLRRCLSVCRDLERPFEIILVDDGSTDGSPRKITEAAETSGGASVLTADIQV